MLSEKA